MPNSTLKNLKFILVFLFALTSFIAQSQANSTPAFLRFILNTKAGIFPIIQDSVTKIETPLIAEAARTNTTFEPVLLSISDLKTSIIQWQNQENGNRRLTHLGIFYGLETTGSQHKMNLSMWSVRLDDSPNADLRERPSRISNHISSGKNISLSDDIELKNGHNAMRRHFKETFIPLYPNQKIIFGAYMRLGKMIEALDALTSQNCDKLRITYGFMKAISDDDPNCFHLIFRGVNSSTNSLSSSIFSTFDGERGYSGPKPSCPPFGEPRN